MPALRPLAPAPMVPASSTATCLPRRASAAAAASPVKPAPTTATSTSRGSGVSGNAGAAVSSHQRGVSRYSSASGAARTLLLSRLGRDVHNLLNTCRFGGQGGGRTHRRGGPPAGREPLDPAR